MHFLTVKVQIIKSDFFYNYCLFVCMSITDILMVTLSMLEFYCRLKYVHDDYCNKNDIIFKA